MNNKNFYRELMGDVPRQSIKSERSVSKDYLENKYRQQQDLYSAILSGQKYTQFDCFVAELNIVPRIKNVIFNAPVTVVFWEDGTKTVVKAHGEAFDPEKGLTMAITKKAFGNRGKYFDTIKKWTAQYKEAPDNGQK